MVALSGEFKDEEERVNIKLMWSGLCLILLTGSPGFTQTGGTKEDYLRDIRKSAEKTWQDYETAYNVWQQSDRSTRPQTSPQPSSYWARREGLLYAVTREKRYAERARRILLEASWSDNHYTLLVLKQIKDSGVLSADDLKAIEKKIVESADQAVLYWVEWGAMNHCSNHLVNSLTASIDYLPHHSNVERWRQKRDINLSANWGLWSIEDAQNYIPVWLKPMMQYDELTGREQEFYALPMTKYYFDSWFSS
jgi:hypothetical protein